MSVSYWQQTANEVVDFSCDVAVIGGGIVGAYTAHSLSAAGRSVAVLEARFPAAGATGRNAGMCLMGAADNYATGVARFGRERARQLWELTIENQRKTREFVKAFSLPSVECGSIILAIDSKESALLEQAYALMLEDGFKVSFSKTDPLERGFGSGIHQPNDFGIHPAMLVEALLKNSQARVFAPAPVFAINKVAAGSLLVEARGVRVRCEQVALCTNAFSPIVSPYFKGRVTPKRGQILLTAPLNRRVLDNLVYCNYGYEYFRQMPDGSFLLGGGRGYHKDLEVGYDEVPTEWVQATLEGFMQKHFPDVLAEVPIARRWAGIMGFSADGLPLVGQLPEVPGHFAPLAQPFVPEPEISITPVNHPNRDSNIWFTVGLTGHGMGWGIVAADMMLGQMLGKSNDGGFFDAYRLEIENPTLLNH